MTKSTALDLACVIADLECLAEQLRDEGHEDGAETCEMAAGDLTDTLRRSGSERPVL